MPGLAVSTRIYLVIFTRILLPQKTIMGIITMITVIVMMDTITLNLSRTMCLAGMPESTLMGSRSMAAYSANIWLWVKSPRATSLQRSIALL